MNATAFDASFIDRIERHRGILFSVAAAYCVKAADREDLIQEMLVALWRSYPRFDDRSPFSTWMYRVVMNVAISFYRRESRQRRSVVIRDEATLEALAAPEAQDDGPSSLLRELIGRLSPLERALMVLYLDDRPHAEIASILGISRTNVATKIGRIKERLRRDVAGMPSEHGEYDGIRRT